MNDFTFWMDILVIPLFIFLARIVDVSLGTIRIILLSKGYKLIVPLIGFFEAFVWVIAISRIMQNLDNWICYVAYAGGFATGNYVGILLEQKLALGFEMVRVITKMEAEDLVNELRSKGYGVTFVEARGAKGDVGVVYIIIKRKRLQQVISIIRKFNPNALYTVEDIRFVNKDIYHLQTAPGIRTRRLFSLRPR